MTESENRAPSPTQVYNNGIWRLRTAMLYWDIGHYGYDLIYWGATFMAFFFSALWEESFKIKEAAQEGLADAARRLAEETEYEYEPAETGQETSEVATSVETDEFTLGELNSYAAFVVAAIFTLLFKYVVFPWIFMSLVPRLKRMTSDSFALSMFCSFKAFGKVVKLCTEFALPLWLVTAGEEAPDTSGSTSAVTSIGEYFGDFLFAPWLFVVYIMPVLKSIISHAQTKKEAEP